MKYLIAIFILCALSLSIPSWSSQEAKPKSPPTKGLAPKAEERGHDDEEHEHEGEEKTGHPHGAKEEHGHAEGSHEEAEGGGNVGPDKGILEASEETGIKLSPEALKNFELQMMKLTGNGPWTIPASARLLSGEEVNLYRERAGSFKRIDFKLIKKTPGQITVESPDLKAGDSIVTSGLGFLRIAELTAFGGAPEGHSH